MTSSEPLVPLSSDRGRGASEIYNSSMYNCYGVLEPLRGDPFPQNSIHLLRSVTGRLGPSHRSVAPFELFVHYICLGSPPQGHRLGFMVWGFYAYKPVCLVTPMVLPQETQISQTRSNYLILGPQIWNFDESACTMPGWYFIGKFAIIFIRIFYEKLALFHFLNGPPVTLICYLLTQIYPKNTVFDTQLPFKSLKSK